ncbi:hydroxymethylglutaryl-CoA lyase [Mechercharimyces sp. CAU 1602]|uniref:hydroxymethylglutaryl-CoA lyase n=1 Tax=Mechercharimyces sp. CAU 1602 TaxID=2973933 RepID=UPI0037C68E47
MVKIVEVGLRDGLQNESTFIPTEIKVECIQGLIAAGLKHLEVTSFVHPKWIPSLRDADKLVTSLPRVHEVSYRALVPNRRGLERALAADIDEVAVFLSASETHNKKNINQSIADSLTSMQEVTALAISAKKKVRGYVSTVFGCPYEGKVSHRQVIEICERLLSYGVYEISLGDTIGVATPKQVKQMLRSLGEYVPMRTLAGHFHDTHGTALANSYVALEEGISTLDSSFGGLGGCPYAPGAAGNMATEDLIYMLEGNGVSTGVNLSNLCAVSVKLQEWLQKPLPSRVLHHYVAAAKR